MKGNFKRVSFYLILNIVVSALTTWLVVSLMLRFDVLPAFGTAEILIPADSPGFDSLAAGVVTSDIVEISNVIGAGDIDIEYVEIQHIGEIELALEGWELVDEQGNTFTFPGLTLHSGGAVRVYSKVGPLSAIELYWGLDGSVCNSGERVVLLDAENEPQASFEVP